MPLGAKVYKKIVAPPTFLGYASNVLVENVLCQ